MVCRPNAASPAPAACLRQHLHLIGLTRVNVHYRGAAVEELSNGFDVHPRVATQVLKHSQITVTMQVYSEVPSDATKDALRRLGKSLDG